MTEGNSEVNPRSQPIRRGKNPGTFIGMFGFKNLSKRKTVTLASRLQDLQDPKFNSIIYLFSLLYFQEILTGS
jgi:hypothetical protein